MLVQVARHCPQHLVVSLWRRKSLLLAAIMVSSVFVICLRYGSMSGNNDIVIRSGSRNNGGIQSEKHNFPLGMSGQGGRNHKTLIPRRNLSALAQVPPAQVPPASSNRQAHKNVDEISERGVREIKTGAISKPSGREQNNVHYTQTVQHNSMLRDQNHQSRYHQPSDTPRSNSDQKASDQRPGIIQQNYNNHLDSGPFRLGSNHVDSWHGSVQQPQQGKQWQYQQSSSGRSRMSQFFIPPYRLVHLDLKGAPPKVSYYKQLFPVLKEAGANGVLLEYEDMFPHWGRMAPVPAKNAYTKEDIQSILSIARSYNFEVIPLVQTFGHLEFVLKLQEFREIRELDEYPQSLCPSRNESFSVVEHLIDQVVALHPYIRWLHIGCDEVYHLGYCSKCMRLDRDTLFLSWVARVARYVREKHNLIPIIWDDMLRQIPTEKLKEFQLGSLVEPMVWTYVKDVYRFVPYNVWMTYSEVFPFIWAASAFKGAFGETLTVPNVKMHLENNEAWLEVMNEQHKKFSAFRGIILTGWQRYDHLAALCELLPAGVPSLVVSLLTVTQGYFSQQLFSKFHQILQCTVHPRGQVDMDSDPYLWQRASSCFFPGSAVFRLTQHHSDAVKRVTDYLYDVTVHKAWLTEYNVRHNMSSPMRVDEGLTDYSSIYYPLTSLVRTARDALREVYDEFTVAEWIEQNVYPYIVKMEQLWKDGMNLKKARVWPKRPLPPLDSLKKFSVGTYEDSANGKGLA